MFGSESWVIHHSCTLCILALSGRGVAHYREYGVKRVYERVYSEYSIEEGGGAL
jgi:hypothetical protein